MKTTSFKNITLSIFALVAAATLLVSCGKSNDSKPANTNTSHKVIYKATTTASAINIVSYTNAQGDQTNLTSLTSPTYTSPEITVSESIGALTFVVTGSGGNATSTTTVQIYVDGKVVKSNTSTGANISASTSYIF